MTSTLERSRRIEILLNELHYERHFRRALLSELVDELEQEGADVPARKAKAEAARRLLDEVEAGQEDAAFVQEVDRIAGL